MSLLLLLTGAPAVTRDTFQANAFQGQAFQIGAPTIGTRLYFPSTGTAAASKPFNAGWEDTTSASPARRSLKTAVSSSAMTTISFSDLDTTDRDILMYSGLSAPLSGDQTISVQSIRLAIRASETFALNNEFVTWVVEVVSNDGQTVRGTIVAIGRDDVEIATSLTDRYLTATSGSVSALNGDRISVELGVGGAPIAQHDSSIRVGDAAGSDLPYDDTTTTDLNPFIQFSQALVFGSDVAGFTYPRQSRYIPDPDIQTPSAYNQIRL